MHVCETMDGWLRECVSVSVLDLRKLNYLTTVLQENGWQMF